MSSPTRWLGWSDYVTEFHAQRSGITEAVVSKCVDGFGGDPYRWAREALGRGPVLDVGAGSGSLSADVPGWVGLDPSAGELAASHRSRHGPLVRAVAEGLPVAPGAVGCVAMVLSLMVVDDPTRALAEAGRTLRAGGRLVLLIPAPDPVTWLDRIRYAALLLVIGRRTLPFPHDEVGRDLPELLHDVGFEVVSDRSRRFAYPMEARGAADRFVDSLYLPELTPRRLRSARRLVGAWGRRPLGLPFRLLVAERGPGQGAGRQEER